MRKRQCLVCGAPTYWNQKYGNTNKKKYCSPECTYIVRRDRMIALNKRLKLRRDLTHFFSFRMPKNIYPHKWLPIQIVIEDELSPT